MSRASRKARKAAEQARKERQAAAEAAAAAAHDRLDQVLDAATQARQKASDAYQEKVAPRVNNFVSKVQPAVEGAYENVSDRIQNDVAPRIHNAWDKAQKNPKVRTAANRSASAVAALRGDISLPKDKLPVAEPKPEKKKNRRWGRRILTGIGIVAVLAAIFAFLRSILSTDEEGWTPQEPNRPNQDNKEISWGENPLKKDDEADSAEESKTEPRDYGEGSYVGENPPEDYKIKGNERSMKYHVEGTGGYERTIADVWFNSEEAAQKAGFTKAQR